MPTIETLLDHDNHEFADLLKEALEYGVGEMSLRYMRMAYSLGAIAADTKALEHIANMRKEVEHAV